MTILDMKYITCSLGDIMFTIMRLMKDFVFLFICIYTFPMKEKSSFSCMVFIINTIVSLFFSIVNISY